MSRVKWMSIVAAIAAMTTAVPATAAPSKGPEATVQAYLAAIRSGDKRAFCALMDRAQLTRASCVRLAISRPMKLSRPRISSSLVRGRSARVVVDLVMPDYEQGRPTMLRNRIVLRRMGGAWKVVSAGALSPTGFEVSSSVSDPRPRGRRAALRRLADDALVSVSGSAGDMMCGLLARGAPFGGRRGTCGQLNLPDEREGAPQVFRLARYAAQLTDARHARLDLTVVVARAVATRRRPGWRVVSRTVRDRMHAVRVGDRWQLVKPSRVFYLAAGVPAPTDVLTAAPVATWPSPMVAVPTVTEVPTPPACRVPVAFMRSGLCRRIAGMAAVARPDGGALLVWSEEGRAGMLDLIARARATSAGTNVGVAGDLRVPSAGADDDDGRWLLAGGGLTSVAGGSVLLEQSITDPGVRAVPLDEAGGVRGPAQVVVPIAVGEEDFVPLLVAAGPAGADGVSVLVEGAIGNRPAAFLKRLAPDGAVTGAPVAIEGLDVVDPLTTAAALPAGGVLLVSPTSGFVGGEGIVVRVIGSDGRQVGAGVIQRAVGDRVVATAPAVAVGPMGHILVIWKERDRRGRAFVRTWVVDPGAPSAATPVALPTVGDVRDRDRAEYDELPPPNGVVATAVADGTWRVAWTQPKTDDFSAVWAARLDARGAVVGSLAHITDRVDRTAYSDLGLALAGDTVAWVSPAVTGALAQIRAAPVP